MTKKCCIKACKSESYGGCGISFHIFPRKQEIKQRWLDVLPVPVNVTKNSLVCSLHFNPEDFYEANSRKMIKSYAVPSIFPPVQKAPKFTAKVNRPSESPRLRPRVEKVTSQTTGLIKHLISREVHDESLNAVLQDHNYHQHILPSPSQPTVPSLSIGPNVPSPSTEPKEPSPSTGPNEPSPSTGRNVPSPSIGRNVLSPSTGPNVLSPSIGRNVLSPSTGPNVLSPSIGRNVLSPSTGPIVPSSSTGPIVPSTSIGPKVPPSSTGRKLPSPSTGPNEPSPSTGRNVPSPSTGPKREGTSPSIRPNVPSPSTEPKVPSPSTGPNEPSPSTGPKKQCDTLSDLPESKDIIVNVYNFLHNEYQYMKEFLGHSGDLVPLEGILGRTAKATGVSEQTVSNILRERKRPRDEIVDNVEAKHVRQSQRISNMIVEESRLSANSVKKVNLPILPGHNADEVGETNQDENEMGTLNLKFEVDEEYSEAGIKRLVMTIDPLGVKPTPTDHKTPSPEQIKMEEGCEIEMEYEDMEYIQSTSPVHHELSPTYPGVKLEPSDPLSLDEYPSPTIQNTRVYGVSDQLARGRILTISKHRKKKSD